MPAIPRFAMLSAIYAVAAVVPGERAIELPDRDALAEQRQALFEEMKTELHLSETQLASLREIFANSPVLGQGNPALSVHPMTPAECRALRQTASLVAAVAFANTVGQQQP